MERDQIRKAVESLTERVHGPQRWLSFHRPSKKEVNLYQDQEMLAAISKAVGPTLETGLVRLIGKTSEYVMKVQGRGIARDSEFAKQFIADASQIVLEKPEETLDTNLFTGLTSAKMDMHQRMDGVLEFMHATLSVEDPKGARTIMNELKRHLDIETKKPPFYHKFLIGLGIGEETVDELFSRFTGRWELRQQVRAAIEASAGSITGKLMVESLAALNDITLAFHDAREALNETIEVRNYDVADYKKRAATAVQEEQEALKQLDEVRRRLQDSKMNSTQNILASSPILASPGLDKQLERQKARTEISEADINGYADAVIEHGNASEQADAAVTRSLATKMLLHTGGTRSLQLQDARAMLGDDYREALKYIYSILFYWVQAQGLIARTVHDYTHTRNTMARINILNEAAEYANRVANIPFEHLKDLRSLEPSSPVPEQTTT